MIPKAIDYQTTIEIANTMSTTMSSVSGNLSNNDIIIDDRRDEQQQKHIKIDNNSMFKDHREIIEDNIHQFSSINSLHPFFEKQHSHIEQKIKWKQMNTVRKLVPHIEHDLQQIISESTFLNNKERRRRISQYPLFHRSEVITGQLLGTGGFSNVYEVIGYQLDNRISQSLSTSQRLLREKAVDDAIDPRTGRGRYAIKQLQGRKLLDQGIQSFHYAATDLAVEVEYMSLLNHPNILAIRGLPINCIKAFMDGHYDSYFMICDRLHETLDDRINSWKKVTSENICPNNLTKIEYSLQLAKALKYLHQHRIVFRDIKPQNIAFSIDNIDRLILFDFGLVRELPPSDGNNVNDVYVMSGVGTKRYMAPEVINDSRYNLKVDVYSWSMILWEILTNTKPYMYHSVEEHRITVCQGGLRPIINTLEWPKSIQYLLEGSWTECINKRFDISEVCDILERIINNSPKHHQQQQHRNIIYVDQMIRVDKNQLMEINRPILQCLNGRSHENQYQSYPQTAYERVFGIPQMTESTSDSSSFNFELMKNTLPLQVSKEIDFSITTNCGGNINYDDDEIQETYYNNDNINYNVEDAIGDLVCETDDGIEVFIADENQQHHCHNHCHSNAIAV